MSVVPLTGGRAKIATAVVDVGGALGLGRLLVSATLMQIPSGNGPATTARLSRLDHPAILLGGVLLRSVMLGRRESAALHGVGDLLAPAASEAEPFSVAVRALAPCRLAVLDQGTLAQAATDPAVLERLMERGARQSDMLRLQSVLVQLASIEDRLEILLPQLSDRWGTVNGDGVMLPAFFTHSVLAALIGARRPSLTTAMGEMVRTGRLRRLDDRRWLLTRQIAGLRAA